MLFSSVFTSLVLVVHQVLHFGLLVSFVIDVREMLMELLYTTATTAHSTTNSARHAFVRLKETGEGGMESPWITDDAEVSTTHMYFGASVVEGCDVDLSSVLVKLFVWIFV